VDKKINKTLNIDTPEKQQLLFAPDDKRKGFAVENLIRFSESFLHRLNPAEIYRLSELQLEL
jgi:hypothetical protein